LKERSTLNRKERRSSGERGPGHPTVELAYIHPGEVSAAFMSSVLRCRDYEMVRTQRLLGVRERRSRSGSIAKARNEMTAVFLQGESDYLWMVDADMGFPRTALQQMLTVIDPIERPIIGGLCFAHRTDGYDEETMAEFFGHIPTVSVWKKNDDGEVVAFHTVDDYPRDALCKVDTTGAAFLLIHRSVLERMQAEYGNRWWTQIQHPERDDVFGEDTSFFVRCDELGIPLHVDTRVKTSHDKGGIFLTEQTYERQQLLAATLAGLEDGTVTTAPTEGHAAA
jgi:hypothetical protein